MRFETETWRKLYVSESLAHRAMSLMARGLRDYLLRFAEPDGTLLRGCESATELLRVLGARSSERRAVSEGLEELLEVGFLGLEAGRLWIRKFEEAQKRQSPGALRQQRYAKRQRGVTADVTADVTERQHDDAILTSLPIRSETIRSEEREGEREREEPAAPVPLARKAARRLAPVVRSFPEDFEPDETCRAIAQQAQIPMDSELSKARDWAIAHGKRCKDWQAFFRNWLRKSAEFAQRNGKVPGLVQHELALSEAQQNRAKRIAERALRQAGLR